ncbi:AMP-binding protein [Intrasporangium sp.]|uniref:AMP-binding protein n=1 Tax=Intrasporangium sp. TaxID=1925024 RepID=UPI0032217486
MTSTSGPTPTDSGQTDPGQATAARLAEAYRAAGWWTGERLSDRFARLVDAGPDRPALVDDRGVVLTRAQLWHAAGAFAADLRDSGVRERDRVLIYLPNTAAWQVAFLGALRLGAIPATLPLTTDATTLSYVVGLVGARAIVAPRTSRGRTTGEWALAAARATGRSVALALVDADGPPSWSHVDGAGEPPEIPDGVAHLMFTSSTTGMPKAVMHTEDTLATVNRAFADRFGVDEDTPIFMPSPLGHSVGAWHGGRLALWTGATLVLQEHWDPAHGLELVERHRCAFTAAATPFLKDIMDVPWEREGPKLASLRIFLCGGAPVPPSLLEDATRQAPDTFVTVLWGMTEGAGTTCLPGGDLAKVTSSAGMPLPDLELTVLDPDPDGSGELAIRGPQVFVGYLGQEELYRSLVTPDGFFRTGDLATIDDEGYLHLTGRLKDLIIRGGVNISPVPIEDAIAAHPAVRRVAVIGAPDERLGERICAVIVPNGTAPTLKELNDWLSARGLSPRKLPEALVCVAEMPVTAAGKIRKIDLQRQLEAR